jgi:hypothetical protein
MLIAVKQTFVFDGLISFFIYADFSSTVNFYLNKEIGYVESSVADYEFYCFDGEMLW